MILKRWGKDLGKNTYDEFVYYNSRENGIFQHYLQNKYYQSFPNYTNSYRYYLDQGEKNNDIATVSITFLWNREVFNNFGTYGTLGIQLVSAYYTRVQSHKIHMLKVMKFFIRYFNLQC